MAEILFLQRGNHRATDDFERFLDGTLLPFTRTYFKEVEENGVKKQVEEKVTHGLQIGRREYKIVGLAIPDSQVDTVLNGLDIGDGKVHPAQASIATAFLRKAMGAKKLPKRKNRKTSTMAIPREGVAIYMIGVRKDKESTWLDPVTGKPMFLQENI